MRYIFLFLFGGFSVLLVAQGRYDVSSSTEFSIAQGQASAGDTIVWLAGTYAGVRMDIEKDGLVITADTYGTVLFTGGSRAVIDADEITFAGLQYVGGSIGSLNVINVNGRDVLITHVNIQNYTSHKYLVVEKESRRVTINHCNFENRINLDDKNILSILVDSEPGYHKIQYCSFKHFDGVGQDQGIEPIRIGLSTQGHLDSRTLVEYCYFTQCNGDGEIISHKSRQNVYRYNTFEDNPVAELVLRHGDEGVVYGNFFLNNMGGIRVREGSDHFIYNNYFGGLNRRSIFLQNDPSDPLVDIHIYHNTFVDTEEVRLGGNGSNQPSNVILANNVFTDPQGQLFDEETGSETWISNIAFGNLGIDMPSSGLSDLDPQLYENTDGYYQPVELSPLVAGGSDGYPEVPLYTGMEYDNEIALDIMQVSRPISIADRAIGASEYSATINVKPHATEMNTGPSYLFDNLVDYLTATVSQIYIGGSGDSRAVNLSSNLDWTVTSDQPWIASDPISGSGDATLQITIAANEAGSSRSGSITIMSNDQSVTIEVFQDPGLSASVDEVEHEEVLLYPNPTNGSIQLLNLPQGILNSSIEIQDSNGRSVFSKDYDTLGKGLEIEVDSLLPGTYILTLKYSPGVVTDQVELSRRFVKE